MADQQDQIIWENVEKLLQRKKITLADLARKMGTRPQTLNNIKFGIRGVGKKMLARFADALKVEKSQLLLGEVGSITVSGAVSGNTIVGTNNGRVIIRNGRERPLSDEAAELLRLYESLDVKRRLELLTKAFTLESEMQNE